MACPSTDPFTDQFYIFIGYYPLSVFSILKCIKITTFQRPAMSPPSCKTQIRGDVRPIGPLCHMTGSHGIEYQDESLLGYTAV
jgi:hypothetical protein